jgi:Spy/CpxP family protein refolding chaperone
MAMHTTTPDLAKAPARRRGFAWLLLALPLLAGAASLSIAHAHGPGGDGDMGDMMQWRTQRVLDSIGATAGQKDQIKAVWEALRPQQQQLREERAKLRGQLEQALTAPKIDTTAIERLRQKSVQLMDKSSSLFTQGLVSAAQLLTVEQRKQAVEKLHEDHHHHGE